LEGYVANSQGIIIFLIIDICFLFISELILDQD